MVLRLLCILTLTLCLTISHAATVHIIPSAIAPVRPGDVVTVAVAVRVSSAKSVTVSLAPLEGASVSPESRRITLQPNHTSIAGFCVTFASTPPAGSRLTALIDGRPAASAMIGRAYCLDAVEWRGKFDADSVAASQGWTKPDFDDSKWPDKRLPYMLLDVGRTYLRTKLFIPSDWPGNSIHLRLPQVDDADVTYLNGVEVGRTNGWDTPRDYIIDPKLVRFGEVNTLCIVVDNSGSGGGIYRAGSTLGIDPPVASKKPAPHLAKPGPVGSPLPLCRMSVRNGVLTYDGGGEVALWGVNYYPQSWYQYENMKKRGVDMHKAIREDLDDMLKMGVGCIRIHVFDREISDADGNLIDNEHLELLDYLISEATKRGIYFFFTPIAWWGGPNENPSSFSARTPKEYMFCDDDAVKAEANYLRNWLNHVNRYTHLPYHDEPAICVFEITNEPAYPDYASLFDPTWSYYQGDAARSAPFKARLIAKWRKWLAAHGLTESSVFWPQFRYELMGRYLQAMHDAIRSTGARQPIASALCETVGRDDLIQAIADSPCEAVSVDMTYVGDFVHDYDRVNLLPQLANRPLDARLDCKARIVYEFDALRTMDTYAYPAFARKWRNMGVQIACMFQYDSRVTADCNADWDAHYLNLCCTPGKAVSFAIGARAFHDLPRGATFAAAGSDQFFGNCAVSFDRNISVYSDGKSYLCSAPNTTWRPLRAPEKPEFVMAVGDSPYANCAGTGIYTLEIDFAARSAVLTVNPDAARVGDPWRPDGVHPVTELKDTPHPFTLKLSGVKLSSVVRLHPGSDKGRQIGHTADTFEVIPGVYHLTWR